MSILTNLGILGFFKYFNFFIDSAERLLGKVGLDVSPPVLHILLPVGISFYTFHGMSYTIDLFRRRIEPATSIVDFAAFVSFFPQLVAGPIGRADFQLPQFERERTMPDGERVRRGPVADPARPLQEGRHRRRRGARRTAAFSSPNTYGWPMLLVGAYAFALQIYGDFSGYTDMARGSCPAARLRAAAKLRPAVPLAQHRRVLADAGTSACRRGCATTCTSRSAATAARLAPPTATCFLVMLHRRPLARRGVDVRGVGSAARRSARRPQVVDGLAPHHPWSGRIARPVNGGRRVADHGASRWAPGPRGGGRPRGDTSAARARLGAAGRYLPRGRGVLGVLPRSGPSATH